jgi:hypothetical protein
MCSTHHYIESSVSVEYPYLVQKISDLIEIRIKVEYIKLQILFEILRCKKPPVRIPS